MNSLLLITLLFCSFIVYSCAFVTYQSKLSVRNHIVVMSNEKLNDPKLIEFMQGAGGKKIWKGTRDILTRRKQVPSSEYNAIDVVKICVEALKCNDDPQLDHGACVVLEFKSPNGPLSDQSLDPAAYGYFLRSSEYQALLDFKDYEIFGDSIPIRDSLSIKQPVKIIGWTTGSNPGEKIFDFYLTKVNDKWLIDVILLR